jgi:hypothetical protein
MQMLGADAQQVFELSEAPEMTAAIAPRKVCELSLGASRRALLNDLDQLFPQVL